MGDECSPYLELPLRSLEHVLRERDSTRVACELSMQRMAARVDELTELRARVSRLRVPVSIGTPIYTPRA